MSRLQTKYFTLAVCLGAVFVLHWMHFVWADEAITVLFSFNFTPQVLLEDHNLLITVGALLHGVFGLSANSILLTLRLIIFTLGIIETILLLRLIKPKHFEWAVLLIALQPLKLFWSLQAREYILLSIVLILLLLVVQRTMRSKVILPRDAMQFGLVAAFGVWQHLFFAVFLAPILLYWAWKIRKSITQRTIIVLGGFGLIILILLGLKYVVIFGNNGGISASVTLSSVVNRLQIIVKFAQDILFTLILPNILLLTLGLWHIKGPLGWKKLLQNHKVQLGILLFIFFAASWIALYEFRLIYPVAIVAITLVISRINLTGPHAKLLVGPQIALLVIISFVLLFKLQPEIKDTQINNCLQHTKDMPGSRLIFDNNAALYAYYRLDQPNDNPKFMFAAEPYFTAYKVPAGDRFVEQYTGYEYVNLKEARRVGNKVVLLTAPGFNSLTKSFMGQNFQCTTIFESADTYSCYSCQR
jgi:hypothetical protein